MFRTTFTHFRLDFFPVSFSLPAHGLFFFCLMSHAYCDSWSTSCTRTSPCSTSSTSLSKTTTCPVATRRNEQSQPQPGSPGGLNDSRRRHLPSERRAGPKRFGPLPRLLLLPQPPAAAALEREGVLQLHRPVVPSAAPREADQEAHQRPPVGSLRRRDRRRRHQPQDLRRRLGATPATRKRL